MEQCVDVTCPPAAFEGQVITVTFGEANFEVTVPPGITEGMTFGVMLPVAAPEEEQAAPPPPLPGNVDVAAALQRVLDALEDNDDSRLDQLVDSNCARFAEWEAGGEAQLEWTGLFEEYVNECEGFIGEVLASLDCSAEDVFAHAQAYAGSDERVQKQIKKLLATLDFEAFCEMMRSRHEILGLFNDD